LSPHYSNRLFRFDPFRAGAGKPTRPGLPANPVLCPLEVLAQTRRSTVDTPKAPRIIDHVWKRILVANNGDYSQAKQYVDKILQQAMRQDRMAPR
jgi:hypothetical protein